MRRWWRRATTVTVFEKAGGRRRAFRYAGKAPLFQEVEASERSFAALRRRSRRRLRAPRASRFRFDIDVTRAAGTAGAVRSRSWSRPARTIASGSARSPRRMLDWGAGRWPVLSQLFSRADAARLVLLPGPARNRRAVPAPGQARADGDRDRRCREGRQEQAGDRQRIRGRVVWVARNWLIGATLVPRGGTALCTVPSRHD